MASLLLDGAAWDLCVDRDGNLAICTAPYSVTQDVACAIRTFSGECWYDVARGLPYISQILGYGAAESVFAGSAEDAAANVPGVRAARCIVAPRQPDRRLHGSVSLTLDDGETARVTF